MKRGIKKKKAAPKKKSQAGAKGGPKRGKKRAKLVQKTEQQLFILNSVRLPMIPNSQRHSTLLHSEILLRRAVVGAEGVARQHRRNTC